MSVRDVVQAAAGALGGAAEGVYVEDVFSTYLYTGNGSTQTITNGIDLDGEGGLVWIKCRSVDNGQIIFDTHRGFGNYLSTNSTGGQNYAGDLGWTAGSFNSDGFTAAYGTNESVAGNSGEKMASWTFRKAPKFFDVVTYTGNGSAGHAISHNLTSTPGAIIVKRTDTTSDWNVWHRSATGDLWLNLTDAQDGGTGITSVTDSSFTVGTSETVHLNSSGGTYVAYLFAHDAGGFGDDGEQNVISCGSFTTDGSGNATVDLGWEPQWILYKRRQSTGSWLITDTMRGASVNTSSNVNYLLANTAGAEATTSWLYPTSTGFTGSANSIADTSFIYIAIRRGPMKVPESGTEVFSPLLATSNLPVYNTGFPVDAALNLYRPGTSGYPQMVTRLLGAKRIATSSTDAEVSDSNVTFDFQNGWWKEPSLNSNWASCSFRRAPGFFDVVCFQGQNGGRTVPHNLGVSPELVITKVRNLSGASWWVFHKDLGLNTYLEMNSTNASASFTDAWNPTATDVFFAQAFITSSSSYEVVAYLFASVPGVSKVGSYTGDGTDGRTIDCGFSNGARFILIKQASAVNAWNVWDTTRGIVAGNDSRLSLNSTDAELVAFDQVDPASSGFIVNNTAATNASGSTYIYLAIA